MKHPLALALLLLVAWPAGAAQDDAAERARIQSERAGIEERYTQEQRACRARFAVTDCLLAARRERGAKLAELRRQELVLNEAERRRRAAERQQDLDERTSVRRLEEAEQKRRQAVQEQKDREARFAEKTRRRAEDDAQRAAQGPRVPGTPSGAPGPQGRPRGPAEARKQHGPTPEEAASNRAAYEARLADAEAHKAQLRDRIAKRKKPAASDLPVPR